MFTFFLYRGGEFHITYCYVSEILQLMELNGYVNTMYVNGTDRKRRLLLVTVRPGLNIAFHVPNLIQVLNA